MSSPSKEDTPVFRMSQLLKRLAAGLMHMANSLEKDHTIPTEELADFFSMVGELSWMAGAVEATRVLAAHRDDDDESLIIH